MWNEKTYSSKIDGRPDLYRIYLDGESIHVEKKELEKIVVDIKVEEKKQRERENTAKLEKIEALVSELSYENKIKLFWELTNDPDIKMCIRDRKQADQMTLTVKRIFTTRFAMRPYTE